MSKSFSVNINSEEDYKAKAAQLVALGYPASPFIDGGDGWRATDTMITYCEGQGYFWPTCFTERGTAYDSVEEMVDKTSEDK